MAIASLVIGILAILTSFLPIINNASFILAALGLIFAIVGLVGITRGKKSGKGMAIAALVINVLSIVIVIATQSMFSKAIDEATTATNVSNTAESAQPASNNSESTDASKSEATKAENSNKGGKEYSVSIDSAEVVSDYEGSQALLVTYTWTNKDTEAKSFMVDISSKAFQDGVQLETTFNTNLMDTSEDTKDVKPDTTVTVHKMFKLAGTSKVEVEVEPAINFGGDKNILDKKEFSVE